MAPFVELCFPHAYASLPTLPAAVHPVRRPHVQCLRQRHQDAASAAGRVGGLPACSAAGFLPGRGRAWLCPHPSPPKPSPARHPTHPRVRVALLCRGQLALQVPCEYCLLTKISFLTSRKHELPRTGTQSRFGQARETVGRAYPSPQPVCPAPEPDIQGVSKRCRRPISTTSSGVRGLGR